MQKQMIMISLLALSTLVFARAEWLGPRAQSSDNKKSEAEIRKALADWVSATNRRDEATANEIWATKVVGCRYGGPKIKTNFRLFLRWVLLLSFESATGRGSFSIQ